ncbi:histidine kinase (plasmid) [Salipiger sp. CCB-MM3]|uniref:response regulator n=1 Tax=Salipiger sp. CCB-MM3 TaxID=1792508 RepID=UPI00080ABC4E|nr:response regulator [Salipiger sp. CCB-MM3]ANT62962.1 histidine kinase [Salipiger sp. CCB-MM3]
MTKVLICEDEALVALDLQMILEDAGFDVVGSYPSVSKAMSALALMKPDLAVLDVRLADGEVFPVADQLKEMGVGIIFHSGHLVKGDITNTFPDAECCMKPVAPGTLIGALKRLQTLDPALPG